MNEIVDKEVEEHITKKKRNRPDLQNFGAENTKPGDNSRYLRDAMVSMALPPIDISNTKEVEQRICDYFKHCVEKDRKPQVVGMANWLGIDRSTINSWMRGECRNLTHSPLIKKAMGILEELYVDYMMNGKVNPGSGCFIGKNHFNYQDKSEVVLTPNNSMGAQQPPEALNEKYSSVPDDDPEEKI